MNLNLRIICWYIGVSLLLVSALMAVAGIIACITPGDPSAIILFYSALITGLLGVFPLIYVRKGKHKLTFKEGNCIVVISWILACILGMLPFLLYGDEFELVDALFESVSGFTTTGASILTDIESLPRGLQFWRIATAWVGGIGIVTLFSMIMMRRMDWSMLSRREISNVSGQAFKGERNGFFFHRTLVVYLLLTLATFISLMTTGMGWFDSLTNAMSACSTCGFCVRNLSIAYYDSEYFEVVISIFMLMFGVNFNIYYLIFLKRFRAAVRSEEFHWYLGIVAFAVITIAININSLYGSLHQAVRHSFFSVSSIITTTGFGTMDFNQWPEYSRTLLVLLMFIGACAGSTGGGLKVSRVMLLLRTAKRSMRRMIHSRSVESIRFEGRIMEEDTLNTCMIYLTVYCLVTVASVVLVSLNNFPFEVNVTAVIACINNRRYLDFT